MPPDARKAEHKGDLGRGHASQRIARLSKGNVNESLSAKPSSLVSLSAYLQEAWKMNSSYEPPRYGQPYRTPMFEFIRRAKAHPDLELLEVFEAAAVVERCMQGWEGTKSAGGIWEARFPASDDAKAEFIYTWERIKWPRATLDHARVETARLPLKPSRCCSPKYTEFISIAGHLQQAVDGSILLPCAKIASLLDCTTMTVSRYRDLAQRDGLLKLTSKGIRLQRKADEFRFAVELFDWKTGEQIPSEDLNICLTSSPRCYTEIQENQEMERKEEAQEKHEQKESQEVQRETRASIPDERKKCSIKHEPYIPTTAELARELHETAHLRAD